MKTKIQLYLMAIFFFFFLYDSPAGLLFYWTLNNIFSLVKNIFYKLKNPKKVLAVMSAVTGIVLIVAAVFLSSYDLKNKLFVIAVGAALQIPFTMYLYKKKHSNEEIKQTEIPNKNMFLLSALLLAVILGVLIPSSVINSSPQEFVDIYDYHHPIWYIISAFCLSFGTCLIWFGVFYWLASKKGKVLFEKIMWILCGIAIMDYMFFGTNLGTLSSSLQFATEFSYTKLQILINAVLIIILCIVMTVTFKRFKRFTVGALATGIIATAGMSIFNMNQINAAVSPLKEKAANAEVSTPQFTLSKTGKNVVVFMLDRAMGSYMPYLLNEKPELAQKFDGFTYYSNTVSYGWHTNFASAALFGGYEYTPVEINKRSNETLVSKQNEALKVLPVLFDQNGYDVTVCDVPYGNYQWVTDLSIYDEYSNIKKYNTIGKFNDVSLSGVSYEKNLRNFFCYSIMKTAPISLQNFLYNSGDYFRPSRIKASVSNGENTISSGEGLDQTFMDNYNVLKNLPTMTKITENSKNSFLMMDNEITHAETLLQEPEYEPAENVDNESYDAEHTDRFTVDGKTLNMSGSENYPTYEINMAALIQMGNWFDYLRENDVYDNTRIIVVADHGYPEGQFDDLLLENSDETVEDLEAYFPLMMVKDFNSTGFTTSDEFMTNADVPTIATAGVIENATNPFTGNLITNTAKQGTQYIISSTKPDDWQTDKNNGNVFLPNNWYSVHDNIWDIKNWKQEAVQSTTPTGN